MKWTFFTCLLFFSFMLHAQKKPLDHSVYDSWQSIGERMISDNGKWIVYSVTPQEGDAMLYIRSANHPAHELKVPRGYQAQITRDSRFVIFRIKPAYQETREARIKKKKPEEFPKDSIGILELGKEEVLKYPRVRSYKTPAKASGWLAFHKEKDPAQPRPSAPTQKTVDSLRRTIDSLTLLVMQIKNERSGNRDGADADGDPAPGSGNNEGSELILRNLASGKETVFKNVAEYHFNDLAHKLVMHISGSAQNRSVVVYDLHKLRLDTIVKGGNEFRNFAMSEDGSRIAFIAERDTTKKPLQKFYDLYLYRNGDDSAALLVNKHTEGMQLGLTVSEHAQPAFSRSGNRLFFGTVPLPVPKDTSLVEMDLVKLDIWHYNDDYLQTQQLARLNNELKKSFLAVYDFNEKKLEQLGSEGLPLVMQTMDGDGEYFIAVTDTGRRVSAMWEGTTLRDVYSVHVNTGRLTLVKKNHKGNFYPSSTGKYILLYDDKTKHYHAWDGKSLKNITSRIRVPLFNEDHDAPSDPNPYGILGWHEGDSAVYVYDKYDVWKVDPAGKILPWIITPSGRRSKTTYRYARQDPEERFLKTGQQVYFRIQDRTTKETGISWGYLGKDLLQLYAGMKGPHLYSSPIKADSADLMIYTRENYMESTDLYVAELTAVRDMADPQVIKGYEWMGSKLSSINQQQSDFNWGTAELYKWKTFNGSMAEGILYKPEDFDPSKKYPMIIYFYERLSDGLFNYHAPAPTPSRLNIPFFVSRGYLVFAPDIHYTKGRPAKSAYNYVVSGAQALARNKWVDAKNIGIQGQSWGGIQVAQLITMTNMFKAAWAGAPVANMFSAYGGIRWESGNNRQFQYEQGQSRIGATPWQRPDLYIENSPLFHVPKIKTPLVIMHNDADGAVPWYQGIELYTAMRRMGKKVWMLNYNGEAHNLVERKNRKDIQVREQQYFDWLLKGEQPPRWITEGVPAVRKGKDWGFELIY